MRRELSLFSVLGGHIRRIMRRAFYILFQSVPPEKCLRILLKLDNSLYKIQSVLAVRYGGGVHTKHVHTNYHRFFSSRIQLGEKVLDLGCGHGALAVDVAKATNAKIVGIDLNSENISTARRFHSHPNVRYTVGDIRKDLIQESFDVVILSNVLEHVPERTDFLRHICGTIRPRRVLVRVPLFERDWRVPLKRELGVEWRLDPTHETEYTLESFEREMGEAGLRISHKEVRWGEIWAELVPEGEMCDPLDSAQLSDQPAG